jgi:hypothetical protein
MIPDRAFFPRSPPMDALHALLFAAEGARAVLGDHPRRELLIVGVDLLDRQAEVLARIARLEAPSGDPLAEATGDALAAAALRKRLKDLLGDRAPQRDPAEHIAECAPGCTHVIRLLLLKDRDLKLHVARGEQGGGPGGMLGALMAQLRQTVEGGPPPGDSAPGGLFGDD